MADTSAPDTSAPATPPTASGAIRLSDGLTELVIEKPTPSSPLGVRLSDDLHPSVISVTERSPAAASGLTPGLSIVKVNGIDLASVADVPELFKHLPAGKLSISVQPSHRNAVAARSRPPVPGLPEVEHAGSSGGAPLTARAVKTSMQLHRELRGVSRTLERMATRVDQTLSVTKGTRKEMEATLESARTRLSQNASLTEDPNSPAGRKAAAAAVSEVEVAENLEKRFERPISEAELAVELKLEAAKERRRREAVNRPVVEAIVELEETAMLGVAALRVHEEKLTSMMQRLHEIYHHLASHYDAHEKVATARDRARVGKLNDHPTHESLRLAAEIDDSARKAANDAVKAAREQRSLLESFKADVQRAMLTRTKQLMEYHRMDKAGTTFRSWNTEELKLGKDQ